MNEWGIYVLVPVRRLLTVAASSPGEAVERVEDGLVYFRGGDPSWYEDLSWYYGTDLHGWTWADDPGDDVVRALTEVTDVAPGGADLPGAGKVYLVEHVTTLGRMTWVEAPSRAAARDLGEALRETVPALPGWSPIPEAIEVEVYGTPEQEGA